MGDLASAARRSGAAAGLALVAFAASLSGQARRFLPFDGAVPRAREQVVLGALSVERVDGALRLRERDEASSRPAPCTHPEGTGRVHALARTGFGQCVVAADNGLFVLDEAHPVADLADLRDGVPEGAVLGVVPRGDGRVFVCTSEIFACVDLRHGFGASFGGPEGAPPPPYLGLSAVGDELVLRTAAGDFSYVPDQGAPPRPAGDRVDRAELQVAYGDALPLSPPVTAAGRYQLRARRKHHHLLRPLVDGALPGLRPGYHTVEVYALDRDLRRREVGRYGVYVPLPPRFSTAGLLAAGVGGLVVLAACAWPRRGRRRVARAALRVGVVSVLGLQVLAALLGYGRSWPFMGFSMYTETYREGSLLYKPQVLGLRDDGGEVALSDWDLGLRQDGYWQVLSELAYGDEPLLQRHLDIVRSRRPRYRVTGLRILDTRKRLTVDGPVDVAPVVVREWRP